MLDFKKLEFQMGLRNYISKNPGYVNAAVEALTYGIEDSIKQAKEDQWQMASLLMLFMLKEKYGREIKKEERLLVVKYLTKYFDVKIFENENAISLVEGMVKGNEKKQNKF
jgi:hypothetical protein